MPAPKHGVGHERVRDYDFGEAGRIETSGQGSLPGLAGGRARGSLLGLERSEQL